MRHGRAKAARKTLQFFRLVHGIEPPYHVILDGTFLAAVVTQKVPLRERLGRILQNNGFSLCVLRSSLDELRGMSNAATGKENRFDTAWRLGLDECDRIIEPEEVRGGKDEETDSVQKSDGDEDGRKSSGQIQGEQYEDDDAVSFLGDPAKDIVRVVSEQSQYFVASQDDDLLGLLRSRGTVPVLRLARGVLLLENPSKVAQRKASSEERSKWTVAGSVKEQEQRLINHVKERKVRDTHTPAPPIVRRKQNKAKGPNPLSCKRKTNDGAAQNSPAKRRRKKSKSKHVQQKTHDQA